MEQGRRSFLRRAGLAGVGTVAAVLGLPETPDGARSRPSGDGSVPDGGPPPTVTDGDETEYVRWQYDRTRSGFRPTSPVNVAVTLADSAHTLGDVIGVFRDAGWHEWPVEYHRYAPDTEGEFELQHATAATSYYGGYGRLHVRLWAFGDAVSIQAHEDTPATPTHGIASYEAGKHAVESLFDDAGWTVVPDASDFDNGGAADHEGLVSVVA